MGKLTFSADTGFQKAVRARVAAYFAQAGVSPKGGAAMYLKSAILLLWFAASYVLLVFAAQNWWQGMLLSVSLAMAMAGVGFGVQHDANHGAYSDHGGVNRLMGWTLDLLGASSYVWRFKHNIAHHTYTNVAGADDDINVGALARLSPAQRHRAVYRAQHYYLWALYGLLMPKWHFIDDFLSVTRGHVANTAFPRPRRWRLLELLCGKAVFAGWALALPCALHGAWVVLAFYLMTATLLGIVLSVVFQLAHCVDGAAFPEPLAEGGRLADSWAVHQVRTTVDFARTNRILSWYVGGLNFQIEHHLFPRVCHLHYPSIAKIVREVSREFGVRYTVQETFLGAVASHGRWLRRMGQAPSSLEAAPSASATSN